MGVSARDEGLLKLIHPGRFVEIHRQPITAAEIMSKYPRHCIARPDVFKHPWIVVKPEAVLVPGKVFYIVPDHTIHKLLKAKGYRNLSPDEYNYEHDHYYYKSNSPLKSSAGTTPKHQGHDRYHRRQSTPRYSEDNMDDSYARSLNGGNRNGYHKLYQGSPADSSFDSRTSCSQSHGNSSNSASCSRSHGDRSNAAKMLLVARLGRLHMGSAEHVERKSCLRKQDSSRKLLNLRVTFGSTIIITTSPRESPSLEDNVRAYYFNEYQY